jgi:transposase
LGLVLIACVSPANAGDREGAMVLLSRAVDRFPRLGHLWVDQGYRGSRFIDWARDAAGMSVEIVVRRRAVMAAGGAPGPRQVHRRASYRVFAVVPARVGRGKNVPPGWAVTYSCPRTTNT